MDRPGALGRSLHASVANLIIAPVHIPAAAAEPRSAARCAPASIALSYSIVTTDRFGRYVVMAWAGRVNLSCWQMQRGQAIYKPRWDNGGLVASACQ